MEGGLIDRKSIDEGKWVDECDHCFFQEDRFKWQTASLIFLKFSVCNKHSRASCVVGSIKCSVSCGVRTHAQLPAVDLKSTPLTTRANGF